MTPALWHPTRDYSQNEPCTANGGYIYVSKVDGENSNTGHVPALLGDGYWGFFYDLDAWMKFIGDSKANAV